MRISPTTTTSLRSSSNLNQEVAVAKATSDSTEQLRIAENSTNKRVLLGLAINADLSDKAAEALFNREISVVTSRLENLGYLKKSLF